MYCLRNSAARQLTAEFSHNNGSTARARAKRRVTENIMELDEIRSNIDKVNAELVKLIVERMELTAQVAEYKAAHGMPVFQRGREDEVLKKVCANADAEYDAALRLIFKSIMDASKCQQLNLITELEPFCIAPAAENPRISAVTRGSYSQSACERLFGEGCAIDFRENFGEVFKAVENGEADYGVVPIENSTAGDVAATYNLLAMYNLTIRSKSRIRINHVLAAKNAVNPNELTAVYSHEQALMQCVGYTRALGVKTVPHSNTAAAAKMVSESADGTIAAICSESCAKLYGLTVIADNIADNQNNFTRFICVSKRLEVVENADTVSLILSLPHEAGELNRLLARFSYSGLNLLKIESKPMPHELSDEAFEVIFYLDFAGDIRTPSVVKLLTNLKNELKFFKLLGNYSEEVCE